MRDFGAADRVIDKNRFRTIIRTGVIAGSILIATSLERGPGLGAYLPWASALVQGSPAPITDTVTLSPTGFPLLQWYPGVGLLIALSKFLAIGFLDMQQSARVAAWIAVFTTLTACASLFHHVGGKRASLLVLGLSVFLVATNTGYYIRLLGAELFAMALVATLVWLAWVPKRIGNVELAGLGALAALLMMVRPQSALMSLPALTLGLLRWVGNAREPHRGRGLITCGLLLSIGMFVLLQVNYWMTGEWTRPAYYFGNDQFRSVYLSAPYLDLVLFDRNAGILRCTPLFVLGFLAALVHTLDGRIEKRFRAFYGVTLVAGLAQIWFVAGYYGWAGGAWIFGSRYLNLLSLYSVIALIHLLASKRATRFMKTLFLGAAFGCAACTASLFGMRYLIACLAIAGTAAVCAGLSKIRLSYNTRDLAYASFGLSFVIPLAYYYARTAQEQAATVLTISALGVGSAASAVLVPALFLTWKAIPSHWVAKGIAALATLSLVIGVALIVRLGCGAADFQRNELASPSPRFLYINRFDIQNLEEDLKGQTVYQWPDRVHRGMINFLDDEKRQTAIRRNSR